MTSASCECPKARFSSSVASIASDLTRPRSLFVHTARFRHRSCGVPTTSGQAYCSDECRSQDEVAPSPMTSPAPSVVPPLVPSRGRGHKSDSSGTSPPSSLGIDEDEDEDEMERFYLPPPVGAGSYADASTRRPSSASKKSVPFNYQLSPIFQKATRARTHVLAGCCRRAAAQPDRGEVQC